jgi:vacuolar protein sorting-associated protein 26
MASFFGFGSSIDIDIKLDGEDQMRTVTFRDEEGGVRDLPLFTATDDITGTVALTLKGTKPVEHMGITCELIGTTELHYDRGNPVDFIQLVHELEPAGQFTESKNYTFEFLGIDKPNESYYGSNVRLRYFLRVRATRQYSSNIVLEKDLAVQNVGKAPDVNNSIKMEVGIEDCLHIEFEYDRAKYHLQDTVVGKIFFLLVRIKIKHMELVIIKRESTGSGANSYAESENITKFEIMDGAPVRGESIPIRLFLAPHELTPTYKNIHNKFSVKYYLNLVLVDEEDRRYFKQQEIYLWRKELDFDKPGAKKAVTE